MQKTNKIIQDWREACSSPRNIVFNITIPRSDFDEMILEIEKSQQSYEQLRSSMSELAILHSEFMSEEIGEYEFFKKFLSAMEKI